MTVAPLLLRGSAFGAIGVAVGAAHFAALRANARLYLASGSTRAVGMHALRMALAVVAWLAIARSGAVPLLAAFAGLLVARAVVTGRIARAI